MKPLPKAKAKGKCLHLTYHPDGTDSPEWWGVDFGSTIALPDEETAAFLAERINRCIQLAAEAAIANERTSP